MPRKQTPTRGARSESKPTARLTMKAFSSLVGLVSMLAGTITILGFLGVGAAYQIGGLLPDTWLNPKHERVVAVGTLVQISAGSRDELWGINKFGQVYQREDDHWNRTDGRLSQISVGHDGTVWATDDQNAVYQRKGNAWELVAGQLAQVSVGNQDDIWGIGPDQVVYRWTGEGWRRVIGTLVSISVGRDGTTWGLEPDGAVVRWNGVAWEPMTGHLRTLSVGDKDTIWATDASDQTFYWGGGRWKNARVTLSQVTCASDETVWGLDRQGRVYQIVRRGPLRQLANRLAERLSDLWSRSAATPDTGEARPSAPVETAHRLFLAIVASPGKPISGISQ